MHEEFCNLFLETFDKLADKFEFSKVKSYIQSLLTPRVIYTQIYKHPLSDDKLEKISQCSSLSQYLQTNYCSWYNYELLSALRKRFLFSQLEDDESLVDYELLFKKYVKRRCFLYSDDLGPQPEIETVSVTCKIDVDFAVITDDRIKELKLLFVESLQNLLSSYILTLKHVKEGCTELVFRAPTWIKYIPTLTPGQAQLLRENRFIEVTVGDQNILSLSKVCLMI